MSGFNNASASFSGARHDHRHCVEGALAAAARLCAERGARLTPLRRRVLELVWRSHAPIGAYDVLEALAAEQGPTAPPTVYRALDFLLAQGLVHRIESLNAFVGCVRPDGAHGGQFLICDKCGAAAEVHDPRVDAAVVRRAEELGFKVGRKTIEVRGLCPACGRRDAEAGHAA